MGVIKNISTFPYKGMSYNFIVSVAGEKDGNHKTFFDGNVHPEYPVYSNDGLVFQAVNIKPNEIILDKDSIHWKVESILTSEVDEDFLLIEFTDGRKWKCSMNHKLKVISPKNIEAKQLSVNDSIQEVSLDKILKRIRSTKRN